MTAPNPHLFFDNDKLSNPLYRLKLIIDDLRRAESSRERRKLYERAKYLFTDETHYMVFRYVPITENTEVYDYGDYIVLRHSYRRKVKSWWRNEEIEVERGVLIGINDDGKLFANVIEPSIVMSFSNIRHALGFEKDYSQGEIILLPDNMEVRLRVQGEIIFVISKRDLSEVIEEYVNLARDRIRERLLDSYGERVLRDIIRELSLLRISASRAPREGWWPRFGITINVETTKPKSWEKAREIEEYLRKIISYVIGRVCEKEPLVKREHFGGVVITHNGVFGENRYIFTIDIELLRMVIRKDLERFMKDYDEVFEQLREALDFINYTYERGNHIIMAKSLPHEVSITFHNPISERDETITIRMPEQIIFTCEDIVIQHDEHGETKVKLLCEDGKVYRIEVGETIISERDRLVRNRLVIEHLGKKLKRKAL